MANIITQLPLGMPSSWFGFTGTVVASETSVNPPSNIIQTSDTWVAQFDWTATGWLNTIINPLCEWRMEVFAERMGPLEANALVGPTPVNFIPSDPNTYTASATFPAGSLAAGLYRLTAIIKLVGPSGNPLPITGYADLDLFEFYD